MNDWKNDGGSPCSYHLTNITDLMAYLGNVQDRLRVIHVAGTNGKGSVCTCICQILQEAGWRTGLYSSPAVFSETEKIKINGRNISQRDFADVLAVVGEACKKMEADGLGQPSAFEIETAAAFYYFHQEKCDFVVLEAGMGGAKDATNIVSRPVFSVFTSISRDHMEFLGETLEEIAGAKAGIIKPGCTSVTAWQDPEVLRVLMHTAECRGSRIWIAPDELIEEYAYDVSGSRFFINRNWVERSEQLFRKYRTEEKTEISRMVQCGLTGAWQRRNIACVLTVIHLLMEMGYPISMEAVEAGLSGVRLPGRFEQIHEKPDIFIDGAHNEGAALLLRETVQNCFTNKKLIYIIGVLADKEYEKILEILAPFAALILTVTPDSPRALDGKELARAAARYHDSVCCMPTMEQAVRQAADAAGSEGAVLAFGSFSYLGKLKQAVKDIL